MSKIPSAEVRRAETYPAPHPDGWYHLIDADAVAPGEAHTVRALGRRFQVFRSWSGELGVTDTRADGRGVGRPIREVLGLVLVWHSAVCDSTGRDSMPPYEPDLWPEISSDAVAFRGRYAPRDIRMHLLEFAENSVDMQHFAQVHDDMCLPWTRWRIPGLSIDHTAGWRTDPERAEVAHFTDGAELRFAGRALPRAGAHGQATLLGPASVVMFRIALPDLGDVWIAQTHTPVGGIGDPLALRVRFRWWSTPWRVPAPLAWYVVGTWVSQWWADVDVWERKSHLRRPALCRADGPVHLLRRWFSQFYDDEEARRWLGHRARPVPSTGGSA